MPKGLRQTSLNNLELLAMDGWQRNKALMQQIKDQHPKLLELLNDGNQKVVPAYTVFQSQEPEHCYLRDDLREVKASQFQENYKNELEKPSKLLE